jgi:hypothetical protein
MALVLVASAIASAITISRQQRRDMGFTALVGVISCRCCRRAFDGRHVQTGYQHRRCAGWIIFNGAVIMPLSFFCLATGPRYMSGAGSGDVLPAGDRAGAGLGVDDLFECRRRNSLIGGAILIVALVTHSLWQHVHHLLALAGVGDHLGFRDDEAVADMRGDRSLRAGRGRRQSTILVVLHVDHHADRLAMAAPARQLVGAEVKTLPPVVKSSSLSVVSRGRQLQRSPSLKAFSRREDRSTWPFMRADPALLRRRP